ncbi:MAG: DNA polymerase III subunit delta [Andreesenia angusta]|nr:DNA polymerase III subunit delta [Andreesenia angusta]
MNYRDYLKQLKSPHPVYLFFGKEKFLINFLIEETKKKFISKEYESLNYIYIDGNNANLEDVLNANETLPFMADKKIVIVEDFNIINRKQKENNDEQKLIEYIKNPNNQSILIFIQNIEKLDGRRKLIKDFKKNAQIIELNKLNDREIIRWIEKYLGESGKEINSGNIELIIEYTGYFDSDNDMSLLSLENELIKLINYLEDRKVVERIDIEKTITKSLQSNIFNLVDSLGERNIKSAIENLENMLKTGGVVPIILHMISRQFRLIYMTKIYKNEGYSQTMIKNKMNIRYDFIMNKLINQSKNFRLESLKKIIEDCAKFDFELKTGRIDENLGLEKLIVSIEKYE